MKTLAVAVVGAVVLAGCSTSDANDQTEGQQVEIVMTDFGFGPDPLTLPAGEEVTLTLVNEGAVGHEFMAGREPMADDGGYDVDLFADVSPAVTPPAAAGGDGHDAHGGFMVQVDPGERADLVLTIPQDRAGEWEIGCFEPGHYEAGMHAALTVTR